MTLKDWLGTVDITKIATICLYTDEKIWFIGYLDSVPVKYYNYEVNNFCFEDEDYTVKVTPVEEKQEFIKIPKESWDYLRTMLKSQDEYYESTNQYDCLTKVRNFRKYMEALVSPNSLETLKSMNFLKSNSKPATIIGTINSIVDKALELAENNSISGNYILEYEDFEDMVSEDFYLAYFDIIVEELETKEEVLDLDSADHKLNLIIGTNYCKNYEEEDEDY